MATNGQNEAGAHPVATGGKKKNPFKEGRTMALSELLEGMPTTAGNWSEVVESTATTIDTAEKIGRAKPRSELPDAPRTTRVANEVDMSKLPQQPPFQAYVGNLSFNIIDSDLRAFFADDNVLDIHFVTDRTTGRSRGFAYVEFTTREDLLAALSKNGTNLMGRPVKVDVQTDTNRSERRTNQHRSDNRQQSTYQPARTQHSYPPTQHDYYEGAAGQGARFRQDSYGSQGPPPDPDHGYQPQGYGAPVGPGYDQPTTQSYGHRDQHFHRQASYHGQSTYSQPAYRNQQYDANHDHGYQQHQDYNHGYGDKRGNYEHYQQAPPAYDRRNSYPHGDNRDGYQQPSMQQPRGGGEYRGQQQPRARAHDRGDNLYRQEYQPASVRDHDRASLPPYPATQFTAETAAAAQKIERKKLSLQPRTVPVEAEVVEAPVQAKRSTSIFGAAKPVDTAAKEKEIEQRLQRDRELLHKKSTDGPAPLQENADPATGHVSAGRRRTSERTISQSSVEATADAPRLAPQKILQRPRPPPEAVQEAPLTEGAEDNAPNNKPPLGTYKPGRNVRTFTRGGSGVARYQGGRDSQERTLQRSESERSNHGFAHRAGGQRAPRGAGGRGGAHTAKPPRNERPPRMQVQQRQGAGGSPRTPAAAVDSDGWINKGGKAPTADANHEHKRVERQRSQTPTNNTKRRNSQPKELPKIVDDKPVSFSDKNKFALLCEDVDE